MQIPKRSKKQALIIGLTIVVALAAVGVIATISVLSTKEPAKTTIGKAEQYDFAELGQRCQQALQQYNKVTTELNTAISKAEQELTGLKKQLADSIAKEKAEIVEDKAANLQSAKQELDEGSILREEYEASVADTNKIAADLEAELKQKQQQQEQQVIKPRTEVLQANMQKREILNTHQKELQLCSETAERQDAFSPEQLQKVEQILTASHQG